MSQKNAPLVPPGLTGCSDSEHRSGKNASAKRRGNLPLSCNTAEPPGATKSDHLFCATTFLKYQISSSQIIIVQASRKRTRLLSTLVTWYVYCAQDGCQLRWGWLATQSLKITKWQQPWEAILNYKHLLSLCSQQPHSLMTASLSFEDVCSSKCKYFLFLCNFSLLLNPFSRKSAKNHVARKILNFIL